MSAKRSLIGALVGLQFVLMLGLPVDLNAGEGAPPIPVATEADWAAVDVVPMPKHVRRLETVMPLNGASPPVLALGADATEQDRIGADYINRRLQKLGGAPLEIVAADEIPAGAAAIHIGTPASHAGMAAAVEAGMVDVGDHNPGERGYEIRVPDEATVLLAGADTIGALYGCVTFAELLRAGPEGSVEWPVMEIRDWPDFTAVQVGAGHLSSVHGHSDGPDLGGALHQLIHDPTPEAGARYLDLFRARMDRVLRWKMSLLRFERYTALRLETPGGLWAAPPETHAVLRVGMEYARARGVGTLFYNARPFVGLRADYPDAPNDCSDARASRYGDWIRCWSLDDERRDYARNLAQRAAAIGFTDVAFHDTDTGGYLNPAGWNGRCDRCRERWGDDYAAATANKALIFAQAFQRWAPDIRLHFCFYPYNAQTVDLAAIRRHKQGRYGQGPHIEAMAEGVVHRYTDFWSRLHALLPRDHFTFMLRETEPEIVERFRDLLEGRDILWGRHLLRNFWVPFVHQGPAWWNTFHRPGRRDALYINYVGPMGGFFPVMALLHLEYAWNVSAPGAEPWARNPEWEECWRHGEPQGKLFTVVLPHVVRNLFGRRVADDVVEALSQNVSPMDLIRGVRTHRHLLRNPETAILDWQAERAAMAAAAMDRAWEKLAASEAWLGLGDYELSRLAFLREAMHFAWFIGRIRAEENRARELARAQDMEGAHAAIAHGLQLCEAGVESMAGLAAERPDHLQSFLRAPTRGRVRGFHNLMAENYAAESAYHRGILEATSKTLDAIARLSDVPPKVMETLAAARAARVLRVDDAPEVDGSLDDPIWQKAPPLESLFLLGDEEAHMASAHTRARLVYDDENLYIGLDCKALPDIAVQPNDTVEIFLMPPELNGDYIQMFVRADGGLRQQRLRLVDTETVTEVVQRVTDTDWMGEGIHAQTRMGERGWTSEIVVPFAALGTQPHRRWNFNLCRVSPDGSGSREPSSILPAGAKGFHEPERFPELVWTDDAYRPEIAVDVVAPKRSVRTFGDAIATVVEFAVRVDSNLVLHETRLYAEAYDENGTIQSRVEWDSADPLLYAWEASGLEVRYSEPCARGGVRVVLEFAEGTAETWHRFGGWEGAGDVAPLFVAVEQGAFESSESGPFSGLISTSWLPSEFDTAEGGTTGLFAERQGTIEFWFAPEWRGSWQRPYAPAYHPVDHVLLHAGPLEHGPLDRGIGRVARDSSLIIWHSASYGNMVFTMHWGRMRTGWRRAFKISTEPDWLPGRWHHIACVWDAEAEPEDWLRLFVNGSLSGRTQTIHPERLGDDPSVRYQPPAAYAVQIGALNDGRFAARGKIAGFRISRTARYTETFDPPAWPLAMDADTTALFPFIDSLEGTGLSAHGKHYRLTAIPGIWEEY